MAEIFQVSITNDFDLSVEEVWPDGDAPENPTAEDVMEQMKREGSVHRLLGNWDMLYGVQVDVTDSKWRTASWSD